MSARTPERPSPGSYRQRSLWDASQPEPEWLSPQWEPLPREAAPRLPTWRRSLRVMLSARVLIIAFIAAATIQASGQALGLAGDAAPAGPPRAHAVAMLPTVQPSPSLWPAALPSPSPSATPAPTRTPTRTATATSSPTPSATPSATPLPSATPTEDTSLVMAAPSATPLAGPDPAPTVIYPIGPPPVRLLIPSIGVDIPVVTVGTVKRTVGGQTYEVWDTADNAGAYHKMSAPPGYIGNTVINGHRDIRGAVFADLDKVQVGDPIIVYTENHEFTYVVSEILVVPEKNASAEQRAENQRLIGYIPEQRLTLVTCTPYGTNLNRLLVIARPAGQPGG